MIVFTQATKQFGNSIAVENLSFRVDPGEFVYLMGASGAGKTTIGKLLIREYTLSNGEIQVGDFYLSRIKRKELPVLRQQIGVIFQDYKLLPDRTAAENISLGLEIVGKTDATVKKTVPELLKIVGLEGKGNEFPNQLSGGESQRVVIARALATDPAVLFADEPTGNLDRNNGQLIVELLERIQKHGTTVMMATHDEDLVKKSGKRALILEQGRLVKDTDPKPLVQSQQTEDITKAENTLDTVDLKEN